MWHLIVHNLIIFVIHNFWILTINFFCKVDKNNFYAYKYGWIVGDRTSYKNSYFGVKLHSLLDPASSCVRAGIQGRSRPNRQVRICPFHGCATKKVSLSHEKKRVRSRCPVFMSIFLVLPRGPLLTSPSSLSHSLRRSIIVSLCLALTFSFSRCGKPSANVLDGRCSDGATRRNTAQRCVARRCACAHCYTPHLFSFFSFSLSLSCTPQVTSNSPLHHADRSCCRAHYVINTFTSLALSERDDAISRRLLICVRAPMHVAGFRINVVDKFCDHRLNCIAKFAYWGLNWWKHVCSIVIFHKN